MSSAPQGVELARAATQSISSGPRGMPVPDDHVLVLFGATGDLAKRKLIPGLFHLREAGLLPDRFRIVGTSRSELTDDQFRTQARSAVDEFGRVPPTDETWEQFTSLLSFVGTGEGLGALANEVEKAKDEIGGEPRILHYLSVPPGAATGIIQELGATGLNQDARVIMEKPFGRDLASARALNVAVHSVFDESQVFRIDHYLGREAVQNILALRFANGMFEPIWNREHLDHVQIDVPETLSIGTRAGFYETTGAFRDVVVTHLFQVLGFVAMEPPTSLEPKALVAEKTKVFEAMPPLRPEDVVRGQYDGYQQEEGVARGSDTETFVALRAYVDNWRWADIPFFLRTGKRLAENRHLLTLAFRQPPRRMFPIDLHYVAESLGSDHLTFELGEPGSISADFLAKVPGPTMQLGEAHMNFSYANAFGGPERALAPYERLIHDVMIGDHTLFTTSAGIERLWEVSAPVLEDPPPVEPYEPGSWGPGAINDLIAPRHWHLPGHRV